MYVKLYRMTRSSGRQKLGFIFTVTFFIGLVVYVRKFNLKVIESFKTKMVQISNNIQQISCISYTVNNNLMFLKNLLFSGKGPIPLEKY